MSRYLLSIVYNSVVLSIKICICINVSGGGEDGERGDGEGVHQRAAAPQLCQGLGEFTKKKDLRLKIV